MQIYEISIYFCICECLVKQTYFEIVCKPFCCIFLCKFIKVKGNMIFLKQNFFSFSKVKVETVLLSLPNFAYIPYDNLTHVQKLMDSG